MRVTESVNTKSLYRKQAFKDINLLEWRFSEFLFFYGAFFNFLGELTALTHRNNSGRLKVYAARGKNAVCCICAYQGHQIFRTLSFRRVIKVFVHTCALTQTWNVHISWPLVDQKLLVLQTRLEPVAIYPSIIIEIKK